MIDIPETFLEIQSRTLATMPLSLDEQREIHEIVPAIVLALRLIKPEFLEQGMHFSDISEQPFRHISSIGRNILQNPHSGFKPYIVDDEDIDILKKLWPKAKKSYDKPELSIARTRFESSYLRTTIDDMLIDYWVGLEALFLPEGFTREMAESVALAVSYYLGKTQGERNTLYHDVINSHKIRGQVVHGKHVNGEKLKELATKTGDLLRRSLRQRILE